MMNMKIRIIIQGLMLISVMFVVINTSQEVRGAVTYDVGPGEDYETLAAALASGDLLKDDTLIIKSTATETNNFNINVEGLTIQGVSSITRALFKGLSGQIVFNIQEKGVALINLDIEGATSGEPSRGVVSDVVGTEIDSVTINNCKIHGCSYGILIQKTGEETMFPRTHEIVDSEIYENSYGITIYSYKGETSSLWGNHLIEGCDIHDNSDLSINGYGIKIDGWHNDIAGCDIYDNDYGVTLEYADHTDIYDDDNTITNISDNRWGLFLESTDDCLIEETSIYSNGLGDGTTQALRMLRSSGNIFREISINNNENTAVYIHVDSDDNTFTGCEINDNDNGLENRINLDDSDGNLFNGCAFITGSPDYSIIILMGDADSNNFTFGSGQPVVVIGESSDSNIFIDSNSSSEPDLIAVQITNSDYTKFVNCEIDNTYGWGSDVISLDEADYTHIRACDITSTEYNGIYIEDSNNVELHGSTGYSAIEDCGLEELYVTGDSTVYFHSYCLPDYGSGTEILLAGGQDCVSAVYYKNIEDLIYLTVVKEIDDIWEEDT